MRFFLVSFTDGKRFGNLYVQTENYPKLRSIKTTAKSMGLKKEVSVIAITEMTEEEYKHFNN